MTEDSRLAELIDPGRAAAAYRLLLEEPSLDLERFAEELGCSAEQARCTLNRLTELALLQRRPSEHGSFVAVSPLVAMQHLIVQEQTFQRKRLEFLQGSYETIASILRGYSVTGAGEDAGQAVEQLTDLPAVRRRLEELAVYVKHLVRSFCPAATNPIAVFGASWQLDHAALRRGVHIQTIYPQQIAFDPKTRKYAEEVAGAGAEIRLVPELPMGLIVVDGETAVLPRDPDDAAEGALVVRHPGMVASATALFEAYWRRASPLPTRGAAADQSNPAERAILNLLAAGEKDEKVARHLGTSVRTIRRIVADLMDRAGVHSRFALGVHATIHKWL